MALLSINQASAAFGDKTIFKNVSLSVNPGDKLGIIGANGAGKTTLFKLIQGLLPPEEGSVSLQKGISIGYLEQHTSLDSQNTVLDEALKVYKHIFEMENELRSMERAMSDSPDESLMEKYSALTQKYEELDGYSANSRVLGALRGLGLGDEFFKRNISTLSGGEQMRLALAMMLLGGYNLLLLDEPTNHLDLKAVEWLTSYLAGSKSTMMIISHDRYLLDKICTGIAEIENGRLYFYSGNYTQYRQKREQAKQAELKAYQEQQKEIARQKEIIAQYRSFNREKSIRAAESREKALERMELIEAPQQLQSMRLRFNEGPRPGNDVLLFKELSKSYGPKAILKDISGELKAGSRIALIGRNGTGKTTLLRLLSGLERPDSGKIYWGAGVKKGYYAQKQEGLSLNNTVLDEIWSACPAMNQTQARSSAASMLFKGEDVFKLISSLSGGERARVALIKLALGENNVLIMDEPTNHLDMESREILEEALSAFSGTIIMVSHDRYFINRLADSVWEMDEGTLKIYPGNYEQYLKSSAPPSQAAPPLQITKTAADKQRRLAQADRDRKKREAALLRGIEENISQAESRKAALETLFMQPDTYSRGDISALQKEYNDLKENLDELYSQWESLSS